MGTRFDLAEIDRDGLAAALARAQELEVLTPEERRRLRQRAGLSQTHLALLARVSLNSVSRWESGLRPSGPSGQRYIAALSFLRDEDEVETSVN